MTSGPITEVGLGFNNVTTAKSSTVSAGKSGEDSFAKTMQNITGNTNNQNQNSTMDIKKDAATTKNDTKTTAEKTNTSKTDQSDMDKKLNSDVQEKDSTNDVTSETKETTSEATEPMDEKMESVEDEAKKAILDAADTMIKNVAEELDVSEDDVKAAMETLGLQMIDILNPEQLNQIVVEVSGEDMVTLATDENLYAGLQELTTDLQETLGNLTEELGMTDEEMQNLMEQIKEQMPKMEKPVMDEEPTKPEEMPKQEDIPLPVMQDNSNVIDFRKNLSEKTEEPKTYDQEQNLHTTVTETKVDTEKTTDSGEQEHATDKNAQEQSSGQVNQFQNELDQVETIEKNVKDPTYQTPDTESILKQLSDYMKTRFSENMTEMEMQLHPASLGTVNLQIASKAGAITAQFAVQNEEVKQAMEAQVVQLKENLEEQGVKIEAVEVTVASHSFEKNSQEQSQEQSGSYEEEKNKIKPARRRILNLNDYADLEDFSEEDDAARIAMEMMAGNGNTLDMLA